MECSRAPRSGGRIDSAAERAATSATTQLCGRKEIPSLAVSPGASGPKVATNSRSPDSSMACCWARIIACASASSIAMPSELFSGLF